MSNRLAEYVAQHPDANGFKSAKSYKWYKGSKVMEITPYFGGSMNIMRLKPDELPEELPDISLCFDKATCIQLNEKYPVRWDDIAVEEKMRKLGRPFRKLPFCSTIDMFIPNFLMVAARIQGSFTASMENGAEK